jgi:hypothetical protein
MNTDAFKTAGEMFNKSVQATVKVQEESIRFWNDATTRATDEFRNRVEKMAEEVAPLNKKNADRFQRLFDEQTQRGTNFFRTAMDVNPFVRPVSNPAEAFERTSNFFKTSFDMMRESVDAFSKASQETVADWQNVAKRCESSVCTAPTGDGTKRAAK